MLAFFDLEQLKHEPKFSIFSGAPKPNSEVAERATVLREALQQHGHKLKEPEHHGLIPVEAVHHQDYLHFLKSIYQRWQEIPGASAEVIPNIHPNRTTGSEPCGIPESAVGQAGWYMADTACPISNETWNSALASANTAVGAAQAVLDGQNSAYALCRPPGHHAFADLAGGFCFLNNSAITAQHLRLNFQKVAIIDVDVHHGNGTQSIFYQRDDVLTVSLHVDPASFYPFFWGYSHELGEGKGSGFNFNFPLVHGTKDEEYLKTLNTALDRIAQFSPQAMVIALGLDAYEGDPYKGLGISTGGFEKIASEIAKLNLPTVLVQEGGYLSDALGDNLNRFLGGFENG